MGRSTTTMVSANDSPIASDKEQIIITYTYSATVLPFSKIY